MDTLQTQSAAEPSASDQAKEKARGAAGQAKSALRSQVDQRSTDAGQRVGGFASDVRSMGEQLRKQGKHQPAQLADQAADRTERLGSYLRENDADRILGDIEDLGRRQPWAVIAGGVALGLVASRFLKASAKDRYAQRSLGQLPARAGAVSPTSSSMHTSPVSSGPEVPASPTASFEGSR
jgi:hypothetical protein